MLANTLQSIQNRGAVRALLYPVLLAGAALSGQAAQAQTLVSYDDFASGIINPTRWYGEEGKQYGGARTEARRAIVSGQLRVEAKGYSDKFANTGTSTTRNSVVFAKSASITTIRATATMRLASMTTCAANTTSTNTARARIFGFFFNAGEPIPGSNYNDVMAGIQLHRNANSTDAAGVMRVYAFIAKCTDDSCIGSTTLASQDLGTATLNTPIDLQLSWDAANNRFAFQRASDALVYLNYTVADSAAASFPVKRLEISNQIAQCTATRQYVSAGVDFDNIKTDVQPASAVASSAVRAAVEPVATFDPLIGRVD